MTAEITIPVAGSARSEIPTLGFSEYWYPLAQLNKLPSRKPREITRLGQRLCVFRHSGGVTAVADACPHRGAQLSAGRCHFDGTVSCPYHGWTFDAEGKCVAALSEGPDSKAPLRFSVRKYPTAVLKGIVFVWMGEGAPTDPAADLPPELSDDSLIYADEVRWPANWRAALENLNDHHVFYVHRNALQSLMRPLNKASYRGARPVISGGGVHLDSYVDGTAAARPYNEFFSAVKGYWPKTSYRLLWAPLFAKGPLRWLWGLGDATHYPDPLPGYHGDPEWDMGPHMPGMQRINGGSALYTRWCVPIDATTTSEFYLWAVRPKSRYTPLVQRLQFPLKHKLLHHRNLGLQDGRVLATVDFAGPEHLTRFDVETVGWRRLAILSARHGGRHDNIPPSIIDSLNRNEPPPVSRTDRFTEEELVP
jgi:nitrite reductase/ring-hydroxylating ferredoxin subunit